MADGGTLFLDEIGDMPLNTQTKLLRVLEDKRSPASEQTNRSASMSGYRRDQPRPRGRRPEKSFREDLYYRINGYTILIPPLRERREDIPLLAEHFLRRFARSMSRSFDGFAPEAMQMLIARDWPGNVRELQNAIERAAVVRKGGLLQLKDFPFGDEATLGGEANGSSLRIWRSGTSTRF